MRSGDAELPLKRVLYLNLAMMNVESRAVFSAEARTSVLRNQLRYIVTNHNCRVDGAEAPGTV